MKDSLSMVPCQLCSICGSDGAEEESHILWFGGRHGQATQRWKKIKSVFNIDMKQSMKRGVRTIYTSASNKRRVNSKLKD